MKVLLDEMYPPGLATALVDKGVDSVAVAEVGVTGRPDDDVFSAAVSGRYAVLTENVSGFVRISGEHVAAGGHHHGVLIALSSKFSRRPSGYGAIVLAVAAVATQRLEDRLIYLEHP